jgi:radical SAM superfamily enzyme YgiQ (UPF0313 family)
VRILLISTYELGHQPLGVAAPAAALLAAGHEVRATDLAVDPLDLEAVAWADRVAISVPMHTAMRIGVETAERIRASYASKPVAMYGLYAGMGGDRTVGRVVDVAMVGEYQPQLLLWAQGEPVTGVVTDLGVGAFAVPARHLLPPLDRYAHLQHGSEHRKVGYVEASHGCRHRCRHCPIPAVFDGVYRVVGLDPIIDDITQLVDSGAEHITFGDPDFLNGPAHSLRAIERAHELFPWLTFDVTIKVEHLLEHRQLLPRLASAGAIFVVSAFESTDDTSLTLLDKGHTVADMEEALLLTRQAGLEIHPSWMPFMPWTTPSHVVDIFRFLDRHDLFGVTHPVQLSIRLLVPDGSLILDVAADRMGSYDPAALSYHWTSADPTSDDLQGVFGRMAADAADTGRDPIDTLVAMWAAALEMAGDDPTEARIAVEAGAGRPRMTEPWFCCAEPTERQVGALDA